MSEVIGYPEEAGVSSSAPVRKAAACDPPAKLIRIPCCIISSHNVQHFVVTETRVFIKLNN